MKTSEFIKQFNGLDTVYDIRAIREEVVTLTNGERLKGWVVSPPKIKAKRGAEYDFLRQANAYDGTFYFWQPGKLAIRALEPKEVKEIEVISNENSN